MKVGFDGFSLRGLQEMMHDVQYFKLIEAAGGHAFEPTSARAFVKCPERATEDSLYFLYEAMQNEIEYKKIPGRDTAISPSNLLYLEIFYIENGICISTESTTLEAWSKAHFDELRKIDFVLSKLQIETISPPLSLKGSIFDPIKGERI